MYYSLCTAQCVKNCNVTFSVVLNSLWTNCYIKDLGQFFWENPQYVMFMCTLKHDQHLAADKWLASIGFADK